MKRRGYIVGLCGISGLGSTIIGTGAFSFGQMRRDANIAITTDSEALIGLIPNPNIAGVHDNDGELTIDLEDPGINQNSIYQFGFFVGDDQVDSSGDFPLTDYPSETDDDGFKSAFLIANQTDTEQNLKIDYVLEIDPEEKQEFNTRFWFEIHNEDSRLELLEGPTDDLAEVTLGSGESIGVSFLLDVPGDTLEERIEGGLTIDSGQAFD